MLPARALRPVRNIASTAGHPIEIAHVGVTRFVVARLRRLSHTSTGVAASRMPGGALSAASIKAHASNKIPWLAHGVAAHWTVMSIELMVPFSHYNKLCLTGICLHD